MNLVLSMNESPRGVSPYLVAIMATLAITAFTLRFWIQRRKQGRKLPPMATTGLFQTVRELTGVDQRQFHISQFQQKGGLFRLPIPGVVVVANADDARAVYRDHHLKPYAMYRAISHLTGGPNIVSITGRPGDAWHHRRKGLNPAFAPKLVKRMNQVALEKCNQWIAQKLLPCAEKGTSFDLGNEMVHLTVGVISKAAFDYEVADTESTAILHAIKEAIEEFGSKALYNPLRCSWFLKDRRQALLSVKMLRLFAQKMIDLCRNNPSPTPDTVVDLVVKNSNYNSDAERVSDLVTLLIAGHDTTGYTIAFALRLLAENPEEQERLREKIVQDDDGGEYLTCVMKETMRRYSATSLTAIRHLETDFVSSVSSGTLFVPKGSIALVSQVAVAHDTSVFPNPFAFEPSRWLPGNLTKDAQMAFFPFSLGKRNCVGQPLAMAEFRTVVPLLIRNFRFTVEETGQVVTRGSNRLENCYLKASKIA